MTQLSTAKDVITIQKQSQALALRAKHATYRQIGQALDCTAAYAHRLVQHALQELRQEIAETTADVRAIEIERLDGLAYQLQIKLDRQTGEVEEKDAAGKLTGRKVRYANPDEQTIRAMLEIMRRRADLLGLDAPKAISGPDGGPIPIAAVDARDVLLKKVNEMAERLAAQSLAPVIPEGSGVSGGAP